MAVFIAQLGLLGQLFGYVKYFTPWIGGRFSKFGQPLHEFDSRPRRVECKEDDDRRLFVYLRQSGDQVDEQALRVGPRVIELTYEEQYVMKAGH